MKKNCKFDEGKCFERTKKENSANKIQNFIDAATTKNDEKIYSNVTRKTLCRSVCANFGYRSSVEYFF